MNDSTSTHSEFRTKELSLAALLNLRGHSHQRMERRDERTAIWVFDRNGSLTEVVEEFMEGTALVEPKAFALEMSSVRNEMYRYLHGRGEGARSSRG